MKAMVVGFQAEEMRVLTQELRAAGHHVLGAVGKQGALTFLRAAEWEIVLVPVGPSGERARSWLDELGMGLPVLAVPPTVAATSALARYVAGGTAEPEPAPAPAPPKIAEPPPVPEVVFTAPRVPEADSEDGGERPAQSRRRRRPEGRPESDVDPREPHPDLVSKLAQVRFGDYHSILEVEPGGSPYAIREQRDRLAHRFSPRGWPGRLSPEEIDMLDEVSRGLTDAWLVLGDPELAARYERALAQAPVGASRT
jgi:hypothetical protein